MGEPDVNVPPTAVSQLAGPEDSARERPATSAGKSIAVPEIVGWDGFR